MYLQGKYFNENDHVNQPVLYLKRIRVIQPSYMSKSTFFNGICNNFLGSRTVNENVMEIIDTMLRVNNESSESWGKIENESNGFKSKANFEVWTAAQIPSRAQNTT